MASSITAACRISARLARRQLQQDAVRGYRTSAAALAAQNFTMPALSPTMTEGNIASWRVKEGEKFAAGDVLLEIETDKATMDVEAQEDGILVKVMQSDGSKGVQVGTRIAVIAEEGDDVSALEIPQEEKPQQQQDQHPQAAEAQNSADQPQTRPPSSEQDKHAEASPAASKGASQPGKKIPKRNYPMLPSVQHLLKEHGLDESALTEMTPTGPQGRLLKGDVLAFLGKINAKSPAEVSSRFEKAAHLDLSNIKIAKPAEVKKAAKVAPVVAAPVPVQVALPVSLSSVVEVQKKIQSTLGVFLPLSTFITRATDLANDQLPLPAGYQPTADELFNQVLGLDKVSAKGSRGAYLPQIGALPRASLLSQSSVGLGRRQTDIIDILASKPKQAAKKATMPVLAGASTGPNIFSLTVPKAEEKRAQVFLERIKVVLENEPGRLVL
ncbi:pyruvate dehydrogenase complex protein X component, mitochondrial [Diplogelasinospora grovesii]|uniref:Pyruvate dehydrogenase complex protein X component, mitochondrial n=1 Tax=Diplogelasinospora grovesii TaxID=303347 RepID=A0AAN6NDG2_9PEZI|nr:pyruvate dehydrogenase complex protein X component, mitochondrial [Diplogelasinospora grovesii]